MGQIRGQKSYVIAWLIEVTSVQIIIFIYEFVMYFCEIVVYMNHEFNVYLYYLGDRIFLFGEQICKIFIVYNLVIIFI